MQTDREYLTEWPPVEDKSDIKESKRRKRPKLDREQREGETYQAVYQVVGENSLRVEAESERVLWACPALARWWRKTQQLGNVPDLKKLPKSDNPNTLLRYVARYVSL